MTGRRFLCGFLVAAILLVTFPAAEANAAGSIPVIVKLTSSSGLLRVLNLLDGAVVDSIPGSNVFLVNVSNPFSIQSLLALPAGLLQFLGIDWLEINNDVALPKVGQVRVITVGINNTADWYKNQPEWS